MPADTPLIDARTYADLVAEVEALAAQYTAGAIPPPPADLPAPPAFPALVGAVLAQDVVDLKAGPQPLAVAGTVVDEALATRIAAIQGLGPVQVQGWQGEGDLGAALIRIFGRLAEQVIARLNRLPERSFLAFLDLIGIQLEPPQAARVPLTFQLAAGSPGDALVPAGTQVAATLLEGEKAPVVFETERDLIVTRSRLVAAFAREPGRDLYADATAVATGAASGAFAPFAGTAPIAHRLYVGHLGLLGSPEVKDSVLVRITPATIARPWLAAVSWEAWDGAVWQPLAASVLPENASGGAWRVSLTNLPPIPPRAVGGVTSAWLRGQLTTALPGGALFPAADGSGDLELRRGGAPTAGFASDPATKASDPLDLHSFFLPFGDHWSRSVFYLAVGEPLDKPASQVQIEIDVATIQPPLGSGKSSSATPPRDVATSSGTPVGVIFTWQYWRGGSNGGWTNLSGVTFQFGNGAQGGGVFLDSGTLGFPRPLDWVSTAVAGVSGFWIRALAAPDTVVIDVLGGGSAGGGSFRDVAYASPVVTNTQVSFSWALPRIDALSLSVSLARSGRLPELGFANQSPVDLSKDFFPFGEKPRVGDAFYLSNEEALSKPNATVSLQVTLTNLANNLALPLPAAPSTDLVLAWEFWDGQSWQILGYSGKGTAGGTFPNPYQLVDGTAAFSANQGPVSFTCPPALSPVAVGGKTGRFLRVRIYSGNYGLEASYQPTSLGQFQLVPASFHPPSIRSLQVGYDYSSPLTEPDYLATENDFAIVVEPAMTRPPYTLLTPFTPPADPRPTLYLGFERPGDTAGFGNRATALYFGVAPALYDPASEPQVVVEAAVVVWEYWNGALWQRLGTRDETQGLTRRGLVTFVGPADFHASTEFGHLAFWLRARWERGEYAVAPRLERVLLNTMWAVHAHTATGEVLGGSRGDRDQVFRTALTPVLAGQQLVVVEAEVPPAAELAELAAEEGADAVTVVAATATQPAEIQVRWHEVPDFYGSGPRSRHYVLDRASGEVRFGDGRRGLVPPLGRGNVRFARYQSGGGLAGNRPAGNVNRLKGTVPYVAAAVLQPEPAEGGAAPESQAAVQLRGPLTLRHRDRAAAPADFEDLALAASTAVARVRCLPAHDGTDAGQVGLVLVPRSTLPKPMPDIGLLEEVQTYVAARLSPAVDFWVVGPDWLQVTVTAEVVPQALEGATDVQNAVRERLIAFLHPLTGGFDGAGWAFGRKPYRSDLYSLIESTPGVDHVNRLVIDEVADEDLARPERFLIFSGDPQITLTGSTDDAGGRGAP